MLGSLESSEQKWARVNEILYNNDGVSKVVKLRKNLSGIRVKEYIWM